LKNAGETVFLSLGSNVGDREFNIEEALGRLDLLGTGLKASRIYETEPMHFRAQPFFLNCVASLQWDARPYDLLDCLKSLEREFGRRKNRRFGPRPLDIDILLWGKEILVSPRLIIPHPRLGERRFVLLPLLELDPHARDPVAGIPYWKKLLQAPKALVYFYSFSRYTLRQAALHKISVKEL